MRRRADSSFARGTGRHCALDQVRFICTRDSVQRVVDRGVNNSETSGGDRRRRVAGANRIEGGVVPVGYDIGIRGSADA